MAEAVGLNNLNLNQCVKNARHFSCGVAVASFSGLLNAKFQPISGLLKFVGLGKRLAKLLICCNAFGWMIGNQRLQPFPPFIRIAITQALHGQTIAQKGVSWVVCQAGLKCQPFL